MLTNCLLKALVMSFGLLCVLFLNVMKLLYWSFVCSTMYWEDHVSLDITIQEPRPINMVPTGPGKVREFDMGASRAGKSPDFHSYLLKSGKSPGF